MEPWVALVVVLAVMAGAALWRRLAGGGSGSAWRASLLAVGRKHAAANPDALRRLDSVRLTPQHSVHLISAGTAKWLIACHPSGAAVITELSGVTGAEAGVDLEGRAVGAATRTMPGERS